MSIQSTRDRRAFMMSALASMSALAIHHDPAAQEVPTLTADVPPGGTLWGFAVFTADEPLELAVAAGGSVQTLRGRFDGTRFVEYSWRNTAREKQDVRIRATALAGERELPVTRMRFITEQTVYAGFGRRATPADLRDRTGGYPYEAVFVGFIVFEGES